MAIPQYVTVMLVPDGTAARFSWRLRRWMLRAILIGLGVLLVGQVLFFIYYGAVVSRAARTEQVIKENEDLKRYYYKVQLLEQNLHQAREVVTRMAKMAGMDDFQLPTVPDDSSLFSKLMPSDSAAPGAKSAVPNWSIPVGLPVQGYLSQRFDASDANQYHPGVDIACPVGTPVLATGSGVVEYVASDSTYGQMVVLRHNDSVTTIYAHNDRILVQEGQTVRVGTRIADSGNSGRSTAPHLHYELRINGEPIDPLENPYDQEN
jgi:murein DD-endopeptidase MepM/ murein hydrolase activator NlpD